MSQKIEHWAVGMVGHVASEAEKVCADQSEQARAYEVVASMLRTAASEIRIRNVVANRGQGLAVLFHETYERLAPQYGYETRPDTKVFDPESKNGRLMIAVCVEILAGMVRL